MAADRPPQRECSALALALAVLTILCSAGLISFNKYLIHPGRFPFAVPLVILHMAVSLALSAFLRVVKPSLFPSLTDPAARVRVDARLFARGLLPIAGFFVAQLVLSNTAYLHSSVAFLQMMKESNLVLVYLASLAAALEHFRCRNLGLLCAIAFATTLTVKGEVHFSATGFALQGTSQVFESLKIVLQGVLLSAGGVKLDALTYVLLMTPGCLFFLVCLLVYLYVQPVEMMAVPTWSDIVKWWPLLMANACLAYALNISSALFIKHSSPVAFILAGIVKDAAIVLSGVFFLHEAISRLQACGFALQLSLILVWTTMKTFPDQFEEGVIPGLLAMVSAKKDTKDNHRVSMGENGNSEKEGQYDMLEEGNKAHGFSGSFVEKGIAISMGAQKEATKEN
mmetsp:Transcript_144271/g.402095  ORF Transcript_144271/g.402095 Transcript_144271/m.402095 type:complete len:397 (+) Transcript_144271:91-1281(+)|eukprot:CAMPEP_0179045104 /NCGR_PEP_ID=MMETSP0796-20121207/18008_1 /TAXON_ID=73915 /ORGANISM="Pyrodinium bahamense, Strain pbaha01" /LENGTH=396 /DNA_ID=CAMNT_0020741505 /DNA_START=59 /DNA_END=1249 /DNA_ORIENTATION=+